MLRPVVLSSLGLALSLSPVWAMPPPPSAVVQQGKGGATNVKVRRIGQVIPISTTAPPPSVALEGEHRLLVVLVETADRPFPEKFSRSKYEEMVLSKRTLSMREYFRENSYGRYSLDGAVVGPVRISGRMSDYRFEMGSANGPVQKFVERASRAAAAATDLSKFDTHDITGKPGSDGILDHVMFVYAADDDDPGTFTPIWPHRGSIDLDLGKIRVGSYIILNHAARLGVFVHEFAHDLGLPDLYDRDYTSHGAGLWTLMAAGSWAKAGEVPSHISAWGKARLGWLVPQRVTAPQAKIRVPSASERPFALQIPIGAIDSREYFLVENRRRVGFDRELPSEGILIWHIDDAKGDNDDEKHKLVDVVEAAPVQDLDFMEQGRLPDHGVDAFRADGRSRFDDGTEPSAKTYDGRPSQIAIEVLSKPGRVMDVKIDRPKIFDPGGVPYVLERDGYRYGRFAIVPTGKGSEALVRFTTTPGGYLVFGARFFAVGKPRARGALTVRVYADDRGKPGRVLAERAVKAETGAQGYDWVDVRLAPNERGLRLEANRVVWVGVRSDDGELYPALNPQSVSRTARYRRPKSSQLTADFNFRTGREPVADYVIRLTGFGFVDGGGRPEPGATDADPLVSRLKAVDVDADAGRKAPALEAYRAILEEMQKEPKRYDGWIPVVVNSIGVVAYELGQHAVALEHFEMTLRRVQAAKDEATEADVLENIGETAFFAGEHTKARQHCDWSRRLNLKLGRDDRLVENLYWLARALQEGEGKDASAAAARLDEAEKAAERAFASDAAERGRWARKIDAARRGRPEDEDRVKERAEQIDKDGGGPKQERKVTDLLQFLMEDVGE